jgi:hypothetical protein
MVYSKKIMLQKMPSLDVLDCIAQESEWGFVPSNVDLFLLQTALHCYTYLVKGMTGLLLHGKTKIIQDFKACRQAANFLFVRYMGS